MTGRPWYKHYPRDFIDGVTGMGPDLIGAYVVVLDLIYARGGPVPNDARWLGGVMGCSSRAATALIDRLVERRKLVLIDGMLTNERAENQLENDAKTARKLSESGAKGGRTRAEKEAAARNSSDLGQGRLNHTRASDTDTDTEASLTRARVREAAPAEKPSQGAAPAGKPSGAVPTKPQTRLAALCEQVRKAARMIDPPGDTSVVEGWIRDGIDPEQIIIPTVTQIADREISRGKPVRTFRYLDGAVREADATKRAANDAEIARLERVAKQYGENPSLQPRRAMGGGK